MSFILGVGSQSYKVCKFCGNILYAQERTEKHHAYDSYFQGVYYYYPQCDCTTQTEITALEREVMIVMQELKTKQDRLLALKHSSTCGMRKDYR